MAEGRMIMKSISSSEQVADLTTYAQFLFTWMIPHADDFGLLPASPRKIKALVMPMNDDYTWQHIEAFLEEMKNKNLIKEIEWHNERFLHLTGFSIQKLRKDIKPRSIAKNVSEWGQYEELISHVVTCTERVVTDSSRFGEEDKGREGKLREEKGIYNYEKNSDEFSDLKETLGIPEPSTGITHEFQAEAMRIIKALNIPNNRKSAYFKAVKDGPQNFILAAYAFAADYQPASARDGMFFWKLNELKKGKNETV